MSDYTVQLEGNEITQWQLSKKAVAEALAKADEIQQDNVTEATYDAITRFKRMVTDADAFTVLSLKDNLLAELERIRGAGLFMQSMEDQASARASQIYQGIDRVEELIQATQTQVDEIMPPIPAKAKPRKPRFNKVADTPNPTLTRAVIRQVGGKDALIDVNNHGAMGGFPKFTYYSDTVPFFEKRRKEILAVLEQDSDSFGEEPARIVFGFNCLRLKDADREEQRTYRGAINRLLYGNRKVDWDKPEEIQVANALAWMALEHVAQEMVN